MCASTATRLLTAASNGTEEVLGAVVDDPLLVVELAPDDDVPVAVPQWFPCVVVAVSRDRPLRAAPAGVDVAIGLGAPGAGPPGWVTVADVDVEMSRVGQQIDAAPEVAVVLAQLLRTSAQLEVGAGLVVESVAYSTLQSGPTFAAWLTARNAHPPAVRAGAEGAVRAGAEDGNDDAGDPVIVERMGDRLTVTLNRPHVRNALNRSMRDALTEAIALAGTDASITALHLYGAGPDFSSGGDLAEFGTLPDPVVAHLTRTARSPARLLAGVTDRVTAHLHGACIGAGIELAAFAGKVLAQPNTYCQLPEITLGLVPGAGGTVSIPRRIGRHRTAWLGLGASGIEAEIAVQWGLIDELEHTG